MEKYIMYLRKSRALDKENTTEEVLSRHEAILQDFCKKTFGFQIDEQNIYREVISGESIDEREKMSQLMDIVAANGVDAVIVIEPERLSRGDAQDWGRILRVFSKSHTKIVTPQKTYDLDSEMDYQFLEMKFTQSRYYLNYVTTIMQRGRLHSAKQGRFIGGCAPYGYKKVIIDKQPTLEIVEEEAKAVKLMFQWYVDGVGSTEIKNRLDAMQIKPRERKNWYSTIILQILANPVYMGKIRYQHCVSTKSTDGKGNITNHKTFLNDKCFVVDGLHPAIISEDLFNEAQRVRGTKPKTCREYEVQNIFANIAKCGHCGSSLRYNKARNQKGRLHCRIQTECHHQSIMYHLFTDIIIETLEAHLKDFQIKIDNELLNNGNSQKEAISLLELKLQDIDKRQERLYDFLERGIYNDLVFAQRQEKLIEEKQAVLQSLKKAKSKTLDLAKYEAYISSSKKAIEMIRDDNISVTEKNEFLKTFIDKIEMFSPPSDKKHHPITDYSFKITFK